MRWSQRRDFMSTLSIATFLPRRPCSRSGAVAQLGLVSLKHGFAVFILLLFIAAPQYSSGCQCEQPPPPQEAFEKAAGVFVGTVTSGAMEGQHGCVYQFSVTQVLKGPVPAKEEIHTGRGRGDCGYRFIIGEEYLVYATTSDGKLTTNICTRTKEFAPDGRKELDELKPRH
jgi:hypothetical protein